MEEKKLACKRNSLNKEEKQFAISSYTSTWSGYVTHECAELYKIYTKIDI